MFLDFSKMNNHYEAALPMPPSVGRHKEMWLPEFSVAYRLRFQHREFQWKKRFVW